MRGLIYWERQDSYGAPFKAIDVALRIGDAASGQGTWRLTESSGSGLRAFSEGCSVAKTGRNSMLVETSAKSSDNEKIEKSPPFHGGDFASFEFGNLRLCRRRNTAKKL